MDRHDSSQYPQHNSGLIFSGDASNIDDQQLFMHPDQHFAPLNELVDYVNPDVIPPSLSEADSQTHTHGHRVKRAVARYIPGAGLAIPQTVQLLGINFKETTGAATASITLYAGPDSSRLPLMYITLAANESVRDFFPVPIEAKDGLYVAVTGTVTGVAYTEDYRYV